ncbi:MAG: hypothetical protein U9N10_06245 [Bacillota bacterium]|nr:hypothetical protein [Bacillota bacterium]
MDKKKSKTNYEKHIVKCPHCQREVLDHMTQCPFCEGELNPKYTSFDPQKIKKIRRILTIILFVIALMILILRLN